MYSFKNGKFAGRTIEQVFLRDAPKLFGVVEWAEEKSILDKMRRDFERLRALLRRAPIHVECRNSNCGRKAKSLTLPRHHAGGWLPHPYYWCAKHGPLERDGISPKFPIHFDAVNAIRDKKGQHRFHKLLREAIGIRKGTRITERFALNFFKQLRNC